MNDIAILNDKFRKSFGGQVLLSAGIAAMSSEDKANIVSLFILFTRTYFF